jgi:phage head maturation protease
VYLDRDENTANGKMARQVFSLFKQGILRAGSIGYRPSKAPRTLPADPDRGLPVGKDLIHTELLEVTACGLPANGDAVRRALSEGWEGKDWSPEVKSMLESLVVEAA